MINLKIKLLSILWVLRWPLALALAVGVILGVHRFQEHREFLTKQAKAQALADEERIKAKEQQAQLELQRQAREVKEKEDKKRKEEERLAGRLKEELRLKQLEALNHSRFIERYLQSTNSYRSPGKPAVAVYISSSQNESDSRLAMELGKLISITNLVITSELLSPSFAADGLMERAFNANKSELSRLGIQGLVDYLMLGRYSIVLSTNSNLDNIITANLQFDGVVIETASAHSVDRFSSSSIGAHFTVDRSVGLAKERLLNSLKNRQWSFPQR